MTTLYLYDGITEQRIGQADVDGGQVTAADPPAVGVLAAQLTETMPTLDGWTNGYLLFTTTPDPHWTTTGPAGPAAAGWDESKHHRGWHGRFGNEGGGGADKTGPAGELDYSPLLDRDFAYDQIRTGGGQDEALAALAHLTGFDGPPHVVSDSELDKRVAAGERECWRGFNGINGGDETQTRGYARGFISGPYFAGAGTFGNGTYVSSEDTPALTARVDRDYAHERNPDGSFKERFIQRMYDRDMARAQNMSRDRAAGYASSHGTLARMTLDAQARTVSWEDLRRQQAARLTELDGQHAAVAGDQAKAERLNREIQLLTDPGRFATIAGYDAVTDIVPGEILILNRTALHVSGDFTDAGVT